MKHIFSLLLCFTIFACGGGSSTVPPEPEDSFTPTATFNVKLSGSQEVPRVLSTDSVDVVVEVDENLKQVRASFDASAIEGHTFAQIRSGSVGENGNAILLFSKSGDRYEISETTITDEQIALFEQGKIYVNLSTDDYPNGKLRGQIMSDDYTLLLFDVSGQQQNPALRVDAKGDGYGTYNSSTKELDIKVVTSNIDDATAGHIHLGKVGEDGGVIRTLESDNQKVWKLVTNTVLTEDEASQLLTAQSYVNIHSPENPNGEIRGQILTSDHKLFAFSVDAEQQVPTSDSLATADGYGIVNTKDNSFELSLYAGNVSDITEIGIFTSEVGINSNDPELMLLAQDLNDASLWAVPENTVLAASSIESLLNGKLYVNINTTAYANGELRGQIIDSYHELLLFELSGQQNVSVVQTSAHGRGYGLINRKTGDIVLNVLTHGLAANNEMIINQGLIGEDRSEFVIALENSGANNWKLPLNTQFNAANLASALSGQLCVHVFLPSTNAGIIRGQILTQDFDFLLFNLTGEQVSPSVASSASGHGYVLVNKLTGDTSFVVNATNLNDLIDTDPVNVKEGSIARNGNPLFSLIQEEGLLRWKLSRKLTPDQLTSLLDGKNYIDIATLTNTNGEIRGQIVPESTVLFSFPLTTEQKIAIDPPSSAISASATGYATLDTQSYALDMFVITKDFSDASSVTIHSGAVGMGGADICTDPNDTSKCSLVQDSTEPSIWQLSNIITLTKDEGQNFLNAKNYVEVITTSGSNDLRGQVIENSAEVKTFVLATSANTNAKARAFSLIDFMDSTIDLRVLTQNMTNATGIFEEGSNAVAELVQESINVLAFKEEDKPVSWSQNIGLDNYRTKVNSDQGEFIGVIAP